MTREKMNERIEFYANCLINEILESGKVVHSTSGLSSICIDIYKSSPYVLHIECRLSDWELIGEVKTIMPITFEDGIVVKRQEREAEERDRLTKVVQSDSNGE